MNEDLIFILKLIRGKSTSTFLCNKLYFNGLCCGACVLDTNMKHRYSSVIFKYKGE